MTALVCAFVALAASVVPIALLDGAFAIGYGVFALLLLVLLERLRRYYGAAVSETFLLRADLRKRESEAARRDAVWHTRVRDRSQAVRAEIEFTINKRLPAALGRTEVPAPLHDSEQLGDGVTEWFERLLKEVAEAIGNREESQRLSLVELANRVQTSAHRIQASVTDLANSYPMDADLLEATMQVDHAATQQARHAQSLKVLCGEWPGQQWQKPLALVDVVRAASGRIVSFKRVEVSGEPDVGVISSVVEPLIHLIAELLANATEYSPPKTTVPVTVRTVQRGAVIEVDDGGLGLDEYRLAEAREIVSGRRLLGVGEVGEIPQTGFAVVGRFADRHGFGVDLGPSPYGGVRAVVLVPVEVLETLAPAGTHGGISLPALPAAPPTRTPAATAADAPDVTHATTPAVTPADGPAKPSGPTKPSGPASGETRGNAPAEPAPPAAAPESPAAKSGADGPAGDAPRTGRSLPQRRSRRAEYTPPVEAAPAAVTPPGTPEEAGDWMEQFFEGGRSLPPSDTP
ncbi:ATP-binding protein [Streptomyces sp. NPDC088725]|uniref:ATP-binding protein n=1 Tax=Streptomyces sp. NPDC088725 TaxID=3365873 RepID=UPI0037F70C0D